MILLFGSVLSIAPIRPPTSLEKLEAATTIEMFADASLIITGPVQPIPSQCEMPTNPPARSAPAIVPPFTATVSIHPGEVNTSDNAPAAPAELTLKFSRRRFETDEVTR